MSSVLTCETTVSETSSWSRAILACLTHIISRSHLQSTKHQQGVRTEPATTMAATQAVFDTLELLENIITFVPPKKIQTLERVSKYWRQLINTSPRIRRLRCLKPAFYATDGQPIYYPGPCITIHPSLGYRFDRTSREAIHRKFDICERSAKRLSRLRGDYATFPRCQAMLIKLDMHFTDLQQDCVLYVKEEIKIGDLLDVRDKLLLTYERFVLQQDKPPQAEAARMDRRRMFGTMHFAETWRTECHI